jgi:hypothetical protein
MGMIAAAVKDLGTSPRQLNKEYTVFKRRDRRPWQMSVKRALFQSLMWR